jgi:hypothetical protein
MLEVGETFRAPYNLLAFKGKAQKTQLLTADHLSFLGVDVNPFPFFNPPPVLLLSMV